MTSDHPMPVRRMKTYTGGQGYVYQYYFVGKRAALAGWVDPAMEYIFDVTSDRKTAFAVSIFLSEAAVGRWAASHGRELTESEQYAAVKMRLFEAFDQIENMIGEGRRLAVDAAALDRLLTLLGIE
jgi:hypothetical protein